MLTLGDCRDAGHVVLLHCRACQLTRPLDLPRDRIGRFEMWTIADLVRLAKFVCSACDGHDVVASVRAAPPNDVHLIETWRPEKSPAD